MSNPKISVIVPVYNVEDYIAETLESILNQSIIEDIEVIMVDDGSTDDSRYIIERYAWDYPNFYAYHKENEGLPITRNYGLKFAKGDYIHFFDSDDYIPPNAYEKMYDLASSNDSDIVIGKTLRFARYNVWENVLLFNNSFRGISEDIDSTTFADLPQILWDTITCNKLFKREFLEKNNIKFINKRILFEDILFSLESYILADTISISKDPFYYWRLRNDNSSITQQETDVKNIKDRLEILELSQKILDKYDVSQDILNREYLKWMNHDLIFFISRFDCYPKEDYEELFDKIYRIVKVIPSELIESLNSYRKVLFKMVQNNDYDNFISFAHLQEDLRENPVVPTFIDDKYKNCFDFKEDLKDEESIVRITHVDHDKSSLIIDFDGTLNYLGDEKYEITAYLVDLKNQYPLEVKMSKNPQIFIPFSLLNDKEQQMVRVCYKFDDFTKEALLKNNLRTSFKVDDYFIDLNIGHDSYLYIDLKHDTANKIEISDIGFDNKEFVFKAKSANKIDQIYIQNIVDFNRCYYPAEYIDNTNDFTFKVNYSDLFNGAVKKFEINCDESQNSINLIKSFTHHHRFNQIKFTNARNKIFIEHDISSCAGERNRLMEENERLNKKIKEFESRKVIRIADKLKSFR